MILNFILKDMFEKKNKKKVIMKIFILINLFCFNSNNFYIINNFLKRIKKQNEKYKFESFLKLCFNSNKKFKNFKKKKNPKISIISPIYNREKFLIRFFKNLQYQNFKDIEIIFIDDFSKDNSVYLIEEFQKKDKRIILIKNKKNKGTFVIRNIGILLSKGKYLFTPDPDDNLSKDILNICYNLAEKFNYDIIRFNIYLKNGKLKFEKFINDIENGPIYQPALSNYIFYGSKELRLIDFYIYNKIIKKEVFIKALNALDKYYLNIYMIFYEDSLLNYFVHLESKSLYFLKKIGYYHRLNTESITRNDFKVNESKLKFFFIFLKFVFEYSKNTQNYKEALNAILCYSTINKFNIKNILSKLNFSEDFYFYENLSKAFINSSFIDNVNKNIFLNIKEIIDRIKSFKRTY